MGNDIRCERHKLADPALAAACGNESRFIARMLNLQKPGRYGGDLWLCEGCLRLAQDAELVIFSSARVPASLAGG